MFLPTSWVVIALLFLISYCIYLYVHRLRRTYWLKRNVPSLTIEQHFLWGNAGDLIFGEKSLSAYVENLYRSIGSDGILGVFMFFKPTLYANDPYLTGKILSKDFDYFRDRGVTFNAKQEPLTRHLFHMNGLEWKRLKFKLIPLFSTQFTRQIFGQLIECASEVNRMMNVKKDRVDIELKTMTNKFATYLIGKCVFGISSDDLVNNSSEFYRMTERIFAPRKRMMLKLILPNLPGFLVELFDIRFVEKTVSRYFLSIIESEIDKWKKENQSIVVDKKTTTNFLHSLLRHRKREESLKKIHPADHEPDMTDDLIGAQCFLFFSAAYENISSVLAFAIYELSRNKEVQETLYLEIVSCAASLSYDVISKMKYLDMVLLEVLRLHPPAPALVRECTNDYKISHLNVTIEKGTQVVIPIVGLHKDEKFYKNPDIFDPLRFSEEEMNSRPACTYIPFGDGPRSCIGRKFGSTAIKITLIELVRHYKFLPSALMKFPLELEPSMFTSEVKGGTWVRCVKR